jgi:hypothetical protein
MTRSLPETYQLGLLQAEYRANRLTAKIILGAGVVSVLFGLFSLSLALSRARVPSGILSDGFKRDSITINTSLGLFMLLMAILFFVYHRYHTRLRAVVYTEGFVFSDWRKSLACRWDEATEVYESITHVYHQTSGRLGPRRWEYTVYRSDGQRIKIAGLEEIIQLGQTLKTEISKRVLHKAVEIYQAGGTVWFGTKLNLSQQGISDGEKTLPWHEVEEVKLGEENNAVTIKQKGRRRSWKSIVGSQVANAWVLKMMVDRIHKLNRPGEQLAADQASLHFPPDLPVRRARELKNRRTKTITAAAVLLIGGLVVGGYAVTQDWQSKARYEIKRALESVCEDDDTGVPEAAPYAQTSGLHPIMYVEKTAMGSWLSSYHYLPPSQWRPQEPADTELVACLEEEQVEIERCPYTLKSGDSATLVRLQWQTVVTLREAQTGKIVASNAIVGEPPRECQVSEQFEAGKLTEYIIGAKPEAEIEAWLEPYIDIP